MIWPYCKTSRECDVDTVISIFNLSVLLVLDIDECSERNGGCDSLCINSPGSFACGCEVGFILQPDGRTCEGEMLNNGKKLLSFEHLISVQ